MNLREVMKKCCANKGLNIIAVQIYARQLFTALSLLKKKLAHPRWYQARQYSRQWIKKCIKTRWFRLGLWNNWNGTNAVLGKPILPCSWNYAWLFVRLRSGHGCTLYELYTRWILFPGNTNNQMKNCVWTWRGAFRRNYFDVVHLRRTILMA